MKILICPVCKEAIDLVWPLFIPPEKDGIICPKCRRSYPVSQGVIDVRTGVTKKGDWDLSAFEQAYQEKPLYKDVYEYAELTRTPRLAEEFRYPKVKGRLIEILKPMKDSFILDLGSGNGYFIFDVLSHYPKYELSFIGLDIARANIQRLNQRAREEHKDNIIGLLGEAENLPFADELFDSVVSSEVIEHLFNPELAFKQVYRVLKKGGRFFITTPARPVTDFWNALFWLPVKMTRWLKGKADPELAYDEPLDKRKLRNYLARVGFKKIYFEQNAIMPHESYLSHLPYPVLLIMIKLGDWLERRFKRLISWAGLHYVIIAEK